MAVCFQSDVFLRSVSQASTAYFQLITTQIVNFRYCMNSAVELVSAGFF